MEFIVRADGIDAKVEQSARFDRARNEARTSWEGLLDGHRFERIAGKASAVWRGPRKEGPPESLC